MTDHIKSLSLKNWLSYEKAVFKFHPGVNMIIGPTDHGKSAMMDALFKLINNRPMGDEFQSWWGGETVIALRFDQSIVRYRKEMKARYQIKDLRTNKVSEFVAFRSTVPQEITDLLRIDRKINIQKQLEKKAPIFLLSENPADIARHLNEVANLGSIDESLAEGKLSLGCDVHNKKVIDNQIKEKEKKLLTFAKLDQLKQLVTHAEKLEKRIDHDQELCDQLTEDLEEFDKIIRKLDKLKHKLRLKPILNECFDVTIDIIAMKEEENELIENLAELQESTNNLVNIKERLEAEPLIRRAIDLTRIIDEYDKDIDLLVSGLESIEELKVTRSGVHIELKKARQKYKKEYPDICPFCNSKVDRRKLI